MLAPERNKMRTRLSRGANDINTLTNIEAFIVVSRLRSFSAAARELGIAPSVVTKRITQLEEKMGGPLLIRSTRGLVGHGVARAASDIDVPR